MNVDFASVVKNKPPKFRTVLFQCYLTIDLSCWYIPTSYGPHKLFQNFMSLSTGLSLSKCYLGMLSFSLASPCIVVHPLEPLTFVCRKRWGLQGRVSLPIGSWGQFSRIEWHPNKKLHLHGKDAADFQHPQSLFPIEILCSSALYTTSNLFSSLPSFTTAISMAVSAHSLLQFCTLALAIANT